MDFKKILQSKQVVALLKQLWAMIGKKLGMKMPELPVQEEAPTPKKRRASSKKSN